MRFTLEQLKANEQFLRDTQQKYNWQYVGWRECLKTEKNDSRFLNISASFCAAYVTDEDDPKFIRVYISLTEKDLNLRLQGAKALAIGKGWPTFMKGENSKIDYMAITKEIIGRKF